ncbi:acid shock protein [Acinetobacter baumannii]|nr:acid shock protein [Acinetobacter baumannii]
MKMTAKIALFSAAIVTMGSLAACQSTTQPPKPEHGMMQDGPRDGHHHRMKHREFTPEQKQHGNNTVQSVKLVLIKFKKHVKVKLLDKLSMFKLEIKHLKVHVTSALSQNVLNHQSIPLLQ